MRKIFLMLSFAGASIFAFAQDPNAPIIDFGGVTGMAIDYGTVAKGDESNAGASFTFTNRGKSALIISSCRGSCGCVVPTCPTEPIQPGAQGVVSVHYDINRVGEFTKTITVTSNDGVNPNVTLKIHGVVTN
jgi:hypothetical protein